MKNNYRSKLFLAAVIPFLLLVVLFELGPLFTVIFRSFISEKGGNFTFENYISIFTKRLYRQAVINSIATSLISALIGIFIAFFGAKAATSSRETGKKAFMCVLNMTSNFAGIPLAFAYIIMLGQTGILVMFGKSIGISALADFNLYSLKGLLLTYIYFQIPLATLLLIPAFDAVRTEWKEAVNLLGGSCSVFWMKVGIPVLFPSILSTISVLFANALSAYATAYALLQNNFSLLSIRISEQFVGDITLHKEFGSALAVVLMLLMVLSILINRRIGMKSGGGYAK